MAKVRQGRGKQGSPSRDNRGPSRPQNDRNRGTGNAGRAQGSGYQNREGQNQDRGFEGANRPVDDNRGGEYRGGEGQDRNRNFEDQNRGYQNREGQDRNRNFDDQNRGYQNREGQDRNRNLDDQNRGNQNREGQDRNRNFDDRNRGYQNREGQDRNRNFDDRNRGTQNREGQDRNRGFEDRNRARPGSQQDENQSTSDDNEGSSSGEQDLLVFGRNTVVSFLERMCLDEENNEQSQDIIKIYVADGSAPDERIRKINSLAKHLKIPVVACHPNKLDWMVQDGGRHQGVAAQVSPIKLLELSEWIAKFKADKERLTESGKGLDGYVVVALDGIEDPRNVGAIIRSAEAQGAQVILIPERRAAQVTETVAKTSAGAVVHIPIVRIVNLVKAIEELKEHGFWVLGLTADAPQPLYKVDLKRPLVIVVGSEGKGMRPLVKTNCDLFGAIPLSGKTESLNASVALGIAVYETVRQNSANI